MRVDDFLVGRVAAGKSRDDDDLGERACPDAASGVQATFDNTINSWIS
jgi:hypothetical protein